LRTGNQRSNPLWWCFKEKRKAAPAATKQTASKDAELEAAIAASTAAASSAGAKEEHEVSRNSTDKKGEGENKRWPRGSPELICTRV